MPPSTRRLPERSAIPCGPISVNACDPPTFGKQLGVARDSEWCTWAMIFPCCSGGTRTIWGSTRDGSVSSWRLAASMIKGPQASAE